MCINVMIIACSSAASKR